VKYNKHIHTPVRVRKGKDAGTQERTAEGRRTIARVVMFRY
jgi:hypothetical protein